MPSYYYNKPTQVKYYNWLKEEWRFGIAYMGEIIDSEDGMTYDLCKILTFGSDNNIAAPIIDLPWIDITNGIKGDYNNE